MEGTSIEPHHKVEQTVEDFFDDKDTVIEYRKQGQFKFIPKIHKRLLSNHSFTWSRTLSTMRLMLVLE